MNPFSPILSITGSDSTGGAGIQADIKTMQRLGAEALTVVTSVTMQNTLGIQEFFDLPADVVGRQIDAVADDAGPQVVKIGMLHSLETLAVVVQWLRRYAPRWVLFSPVVFSSREEQLMDDELIAAVCSQLLPLCSLVVVRQRDAARFPAEHIVVEEGGHGRCNEWCSAIAVYLNQGLSLDDAVKKAHRTLPPVMADSNDFSPRWLSLYHEFMEMQESRCKNSYDVNYYASQLHVGSRYLSQITRKVAGQSPKAIIDATLLARIQQLLRGSSMTVQEIAYALGFSSQAHLTAFFKKAVGMSPTAFRRN
ncbi:MAG: bifunctional hydroxymethylpyrimidine kinase/phosphomethylpyrimidine kinase [Bacteroidaceae bacterium]|nr:bifunctional hydroxymethylpyrimidine kinase/phosphomethylpyrimidine kinase [Bacteroidaceae bacterium]